jgi:asparagine synthase (glutamine-hydrolysing)
MCGIVGLIDTVAGDISPRLLATMGDVMIARGPDGQGYYRNGPVGMTMRRLSIIDIEGGRQPFFSRGGEVVAFQNGEIYNYRELKRQLERGYQFISQSDTEVLAHGYSEWGAEGLLEQLDGMYAIAILDHGTRELHLARDRFGEKPLFYGCSKGRFAYSSDLLALAALEWIGDEIDVQSLDRYLALHYVPGDATIFKGIKRLLPGERLVVPIDNPVPNRHRYYSLPLGEEITISDNDLAALVEEAIESRLVADVPVGIFLSGGLDSSILAAVAAKKHPGIATFSMGFKLASHDESRYAQLVANQIKSNHHYFQFDEESFRSLLPQVAAVLDEPVGDQALLPLYWLCGEARRHVKVALSGEGADEVFAGYSYYRDQMSRSGWLEKLRAQLGRTTQTREWPQRLINNGAPVTPSGFPLLTDMDMREHLIGKRNSGIDEWERNLFGWLNQSRGDLQRAAATDIATWLVDDLLVKFDRMSMAHSLEGRAPYLSSAMVESGLALPASQKMNGETSKVALRRVAKRWLPEEIIERPKQGFVLPMAKWLVQWFAEHGSVGEYFRARAVPGLDMTEVSRLTEEDLSHGVRRERLLFALLMLIEWYQSFQSRQSEVTRRYRECDRADGPAKYPVGDAHPRVS